MILHSLFSISSFFFSSSWHAPDFSLSHPSLVLCTCCLNMPSMSQSPLWWLNENLSKYFFQTITEFSLRNQMEFFSPVYYLVISLKSHLRHWENKGAQMLCTIWNKEKCNTNLAVGHFPSFKEVMLAAQTWTITSSSSSSNKRRPQWSNLDQSILVWQPENQGLWDQQEGKRIPDFFPGCWAPMLISWTEGDSWQLP